MLELGNSNPNLDAIVCAYSICITSRPTNIFKNYYIPNYVDD